MSRQTNYTGRHSEVKKDTTKTPPTKMFGPVRKEDFKIRQATKKKAL